MTDTKASGRMQAGGKTTAASTVFAALRREILSGALPPGSRLRIDHLCQTYGVTINPVREALNRLTAEQLVVLEDQRGFSVAPVSHDEWRELVRSRCLIEACALREAMSNRTPVWEEGIVLSLYRLSRTARFLDVENRVPNPDWELHHHAFHHALLASCNSRIILDFCEEMRERSDRYRRIAALSPTGPRLTQSEHKEIADAVVGGEVEEAVKLLCAHYQRTLGVVEAHFERK
ncbi:DNA-binding GntR family transcriptional regulator [Pararhizobium capsulatum DSM 1112]|uniref:DNA-binding GntR family transcriptional regulator n=1 Tax=Pararhizobium capsulatum DSM 1112 TaxID=1121113 RepID=A0ABU0BXF6_9HYPH|nr:GntR family transcriptional regulator [Pararhizobium capsulatum]MDQ0322643.1 DNA-binding GntR family transcriptional regulator [Pararhizobium capsulatum DSM 1112]